MALAEATGAGFHGAVYGVYIPTLRQWRDHDWGEPKISFVLRSAESLRKNLMTLRIPLIVLKAQTFAEVPNILVDLCRELQVSSLFANREYELNERKRDEAVVEALNGEGVESSFFHDQTCIPPNATELLTGAGQPYSVFTPFKKKWLSLIEEQGMPSVRNRPVERELPPIPKAVSALSSLEEIGVDMSLHSDRWPGGEKEALDRLKKFSSGAISRYAEDRDFPAVSGTSTLSPYLAVGAVSVRKCLAYAVRANGDVLSGEKNGEMTWASELIWREFYRHVLVHHPRICKYRAYREEVDKVRWRYDEEDFGKWCAGQTGYPLVDAAMRQLNTTGWMHNRLRMVVAMFLTKHLLIDWRWGEKYFNEHLVDADFASNNGGWQWSSSTGTDAQPYFRIFNPYSQSEKFDKDGIFIKQFCPELLPLSGNAVHQPEPKHRKQCNYPAPIVDHKKGRERALAAFKRN